MGITERRKRERQAVRAKILDAARDLFVKEGYDAVTMRRIAGAVEYSPTALYLHFPDKEALLHELCITDFESLAKAFQRIGKESDPVERIRKIGLAYVEFALEHPNHYRLMFMTPRVKEIPPEEGIHGVPERDGYAFLLATVAEAIAAKRLRPELKDAEQVAQLLWAGVHGLVSLQIAMTPCAWLDWRPVRRTALALVDVQLRGIARKA